MDKNAILRWKLRARTAAYRRNILLSEQIVREAVNQADMAISWSTGKDSTAMVHVVRSIAPDTPIIIQFDDCDWPTKEPYAHRVAKEHGWVFHRVEPDFSVWEMVSNGRIGEDHFCSLSHQLTKDGFIGPLKKKQAELGCNGVFMGLREEESKTRKMHLRKRGHIYRVGKDLRCCPLAKWTTEDVFAYMVDHDIEINPCYFNNRFRPPEDIRVSWAIPTPGSIAHGDIDHFRTYYPEQFRRMRDMGVC